MYKEVNMRFCDFFIEYKIGLKELKTSIPWTKLPLYRKIFIVLIFITGVTGLIFGTLGNIAGSLIIFLLFIVLFTVFFIIDSSKRNLRKMLDNHYSLTSQRRIDLLLATLRSYNINYNDVNKIDLLIKQAEESKIKSDPFIDIQKPLKTLGAIIIPVILYVVQIIAEATSKQDLIVMALQSIIIICCVFSIIISVSPIIRDICYRDYNIYENLIYDLNQI